MPPGPPARPDVSIAYGARQAETTTRRREATRAQRPRCAICGETQVHRAGCEFLPIDNRHNAAVEPLAAHQLTADELYELLIASRPSAPESPR